MGGNGGQAAWRRDLAALLAALFCFYSALAFAASTSAATAPEICGQIDDTAPVKGAPRDAHCLLCLAGCAALPFAPPPSLAVPVAYAAGTAPTLDACHPREAPTDPAHPPRGPPAAA